VVTSADTSAGLITNKRSIESSILVDENQIVVLGGLIQDSVNDVESKTPLLGDIPLLGNLFRYETRQQTKTNLMVFIRPYIMYQTDSHQKLVNERYDQMDQRRKDARLPDHWILPNDDKDKSLPPRPEKPAPAPEAASAPAAAPTTADLFSQP
jgi:general secretion pathway protein D